ncbi:hypothetical protein ACPWT1_00945 [Ramlibacter sp. MMS24-I3-19]
MIELNDIEIGEVSGGIGFIQLIQYGNYVLEFLGGWVDGVNAATGG